jgi:hypothetical protein
MSCCEKPIDGVEDIVVNDIAASDITADSLALADGSAAAPSLSFTSDPDTGIYYEATGVAVTAGGTKRQKITTTSIDNEVQMLSNLSSEAAPGYAFTGHADTGMDGGASLKLVHNGEAIVEQGDTGNLFIYPKVDTKLVIGPNTSYTSSIIKLSY